MNIKTEKQTKPTNKRREKRPPKKITPTYLHNAGLYYLQRFAASSQRFREVMMRKVKKSCAHHTEQDYTECAAMVEDLIEKFIEVGLLNDEAYAAGSVNSLRRQGKSKKMILGKLRMKGVAYDLIDQSLQEYDEKNDLEPEETELEAAMTYARKKRIGPFRIGENDKPEKELASMARAGFSYDIARRVLEL